MSGSPRPKMAKFEPLFDDYDEEERPTAENGEEEEQPVIRTVKAEVLSQGAHSLEATTSEGISSQAHQEPANSHAQPNPVPERLFSPPHQQPQYSLDTPANTPRPVIIPPAKNTIAQQPTTGGGILDVTRLDTLARQVMPCIQLDDSVKEALVDYTEEFINDAIEKVCRLAVHNGTNRITSRDVELVLETAYHMPSVPRGLPTYDKARSDAAASTFPSRGANAHKERHSLIRKTLKKM